jgi:hypothetical protein
MNASLAALLEKGELDRATLERLREADRAEIQRFLSQYVAEREVREILERLDRLIAALDAPGR